MSRFFACCNELGLGLHQIKPIVVAAFIEKHGGLLAIEILFGGIVPLLLLSRASLRMQPRLLFMGALLATSGVVFNRINVVLLAMNLKGPMPQGAPASYTPSVFEWGISVGLIAASVFLFGLGARLVPLLPKYGAAHGD